MYITDIGREINIIFLLSFLIYKAKRISIKVLFLCVLFIHLYKFINYFKLYYKYTKKHIYIYLLFFVLLSYSLYLLIFKNN